MRISITSQVFRRQRDFIETTFMRSTRQEQLKSQSMKTRKLLSGNRKSTLLLLLKLDSRGWWLIPQKTSENLKKFWVEDNEVKSQPHFETNLTITVSNQQISNLRLPPILLIPNMRMSEEMTVGIILQPSRLLRVTRTDTRRLVRSRSRTISLQVSRRDNYLVSSHHYLSIW